MPLTKKIIKNSTLIGFWNITESESELLTKLTLTPPEIKNLSEIKAPQKRLQWLATRTLLKELLELDKNLTIQYNEFGKPFLNSYNHISISHSHTFVMIGLSNNEIGVDIEKENGKILNLISRFMSDEEKSNLNGIYANSIALVYWSAKESLMKIYGKKDIAFSSDILIKNFIYSKKGETTATFNKQKSKKPYKIYYEKLDDYIFVIATEQ